MKFTLSPQTILRRWLSKTPVPTASLLTSKSKLLVEIHVVSASGSSTMTIANNYSPAIRKHRKGSTGFDISPPIFYDYHRKPLVSLINGGVGREGSRMRCLFTRCPQALASANVMVHVLLRLSRGLSGEADRAPFHNGQGKSC